jgi:hypothetical protein
VPAAAANHLPSCAAVDPHASDVEPTIHRSAERTQWAPGTAPSRGRPSGRPSDLHCPPARLRNEPNSSEGPCRQRDTETPAGHVQPPAGARPERPGPLGAAPHNEPSGPCSLPGLLRNEPSERTVLLGNRTQRHCLPLAARSRSPVPLTTGQARRRSDARHEPGFPSAPVAVRPLPIPGYPPSSVPARRTCGGSPGTCRCPRRHSAQLRSSCGPRPAPWPAFCETNPMSAQHSLTTEHNATVCRWPRVPGAPCP